MFISISYFIKAFRSNSSNFNLEENQYPTLERIGSCGEPLANEVGKWAIS